VKKKERMEKISLRSLSETFDSKPVFWLFAGSMLKIPDEMPPIPGTVWGIALEIFGERHQKKIKSKARDVHH
jgi:hypothetical protein